MVAAEDVTTGQPYEGDAHEDVGEALQELDERVRTFVADQPLLAMGLAIGAGYLVGRLMRHL